MLVENMVVDFCSIYHRHLVYYVVDKLILMLRNLNFEWLSIYIYKNTEKNNEFLIYVVQ